MYDFFSPRAKKITVWSYGFHRGGFEVDIAESTGAKVNIFDARPESLANYAIFDRVMKTHENTPEDPKWAADMTNFWIIPDSTTFSKVLPWAHSGNLVVNDCATELVKADAERVDICKADYGEFTTDIVYMILSKGYRPGIFYVHWDKHPDEASSTMACAGHLQTLGYRLLLSVENYFLYMFVDDCMYELCSWARTDSSNPMFDEFRKQLLEGATVSGK